MTNLQQFITENFNLLFGIAATWMAIQLAWHAWQHAKRGSWHPGIPPSQVRFRERFVSGISHKNFFTAKFGGAQNALVLTVTDDVLLIEMMAPFKWMMKPGFGDLEHYIARKNITQLEPFSRWGFEYLILKFTDDLGNPKHLELRSRRRQELLTWLAQNQGLTLGHPYNR